LNGGATPQENGLRYNAKVIAAGVQNQKRRGNAGPVQVGGGTRTGHFVLGGPDPLILWH
jgi:hypothetical protein